MKTVQTIKIHAQEVNKDGKRFIASSAEIRGKWFKIKFTQECERAPKKRGLYDITFSFDDCSVEKGKRYIKKDGTEGIANDTIWVRKISDIRKYTEEELAKENRAEMAEIFGVDVDEDIPF